MFDYIKGTLAYKNSGDNPSVTIDVSGIGYITTISQKDFSSLPEIESPIQIFTVLVHKEDSMSLYGFLNRESRNIFNLLTSVSGVGPKMAMQILNTFEPDNIINIVVNEDIKELSKAKGVGQKLAKKIIIELKDKLSDFQNKIIKTSKSNSSENVNKTLIKEANDVLISLGYEKEEINNALDYAASLICASDTTEDVLKYALKFLSV